MNHIGKEARLVSRGIAPTSAVLHQSVGVKYSCQKLILSYVIIDHLQNILSLDYVCTKNKNRTGIDAEKQTVLNVVTRWETLSNS